MSSPEANKQIVRRFFEALGSKDFDTLQSLLHAEFQVWCAGSNWFSGWADLSLMSENAARIYSLFPDGIDFDVKSLVSEDGSVAAEVESNARHVGGEFYRNQYHMLFVIRDGKILVYKEYMDTALAGRFIGVEQPWNG
jgi:uncharacterized protein